MVALFLATVGDETQPWGIYDKDRNRAEPIRRHVQLQIDAAAGPGARARGNAREVG